MRTAVDNGRERQSGMTLVEVMVAMVLTAILLVGMNALWVNITKEVDALVLRQKAIFRLNGEMERLVGLYEAGNIPGTTIPVPVSNYDTAGPSNRADYIGTTVRVDASNTLWEDESNGERFIYPQSTGFTNPDFMTDTAGTYGDFHEDPSTTMATLMSQGVGATKIQNSIDEIYSRVLYWDAGTPGSTEDDRNLVWVDRSKNIVAQISWSSVFIRNDILSPIGSVGRYPCYSDSGKCRHITLYLDYPFRYVSSSSPREEIPDSPTHTITLQTIVSQRP